MLPETKIWKYWLKVPTLWRVPFNTHLRSIGVAWQGVTCKCLVMTNQ